MKKILVSILLLSLMLCACESTPHSQEETSVNDEATLESTKKEESFDFDFENARIDGHFILSVGDTVTVAEGSEGITFSHKGIAEVNGSDITAKSTGVTLAGCKSDSTAYAVCVLPDGVAEDTQAEGPTLLEVGDTAFVSGYGSADTFTVSDPEVLELSGISVKALSPGYSVVDASNISMPKYFSYLVFDRNTD